MATMNQGKLVLYYSPGACSLNPHIALAASKLPYELISVELVDGPRITSKGEDYYKINPSGAVPALRMENGEILTENPAIVQYIADKAAGTNLAPANGTLPRYRLQEKLNFIGTELHKEFGPLFHKPSDEVKSKQIQRLISKFAMVDRQLADRRYLLGDNFTVADGYLYVMLRWAETYNVDISKFRNLLAYRERLDSLPFVSQALREEGL